MKSRKIDPSVFSLILLIQMIIVMSIYYIAISIHSNTWDIDKWDSYLVRVSVIHALLTYLGISISMVLLYKFTNVFKIKQ